VQVFSWLLAGAAVLAVLRIYFTVRKLSARRADDWDEKLVKNLRAQGGDSFSPYAVDFFFDLPDEAACEKVGTVLRAGEYAIDYRRVDPDRGDRYTLHALKSVRVSVPDMQALRREMSALALQHGGRYDGWATAGITRSAQR
jgi:hypothetical protein